MESTAPGLGPDDSGSALAVAGQAQQRLTAGLRLPSGLFPVLAAAVAVQLASAGVGIAMQTATGIGVLLAGLAVFLGVASLTLYRFRQVNGVRVDGLASRIVLGSGAWSSSAYLGALAAATWAAFGSRWWLVAVAAVAGGVGYTLGARRWWQAYRQDPVAHARGASPRTLAGLAGLACLGFVVLVLVR